MEKQVRKLVPSQMIRSQKNLSQTIEQNILDQINKKQKPKSRQVNNQSSLTQTFAAPSRLSFATEPQIISTQPCNLQIANTTFSQSHLPTKSLSSSVQNINSLCGGLSSKMNEIKFRKILKRKKKSIHIDQETLK